MPLCVPAPPQDIPRKRCLHLLPALVWSWTRQQQNFLLSGVWLGTTHRMGKQEQILGMGVLARDPVAFSSLKLLGHPQG